MRIDLHELIGDYCITIEDGQMVYNHIHPYLVDGHPVELDFTGVKVVSTPFFNFAIGHLLKDLQSKELNHLLKFTNLNSNGTELQKRVIENAERYYSDEYFRNAVDEVVAQQAVSL